VIALTADLRLQMWRNNLSSSISNRLQVYLVFGWVRCLVLREKLGRLNNQRRKDRVMLHTVHAPISNSEEEFAIVDEAGERIVHLGVVDAKSQHVGSVSTVQD